MRAIRKLRADRTFDIAIVPRGGVDPAFSAHAVWALNVLVSFGYSHTVESDDIDHNRGDCLLTNAVRDVTARHEGMRAIMLLQTSGLVQNAAALWNENKVISGLHEIALKLDHDELFRRLGLSIQTKIVVMAPGAGLKKKAWDPTKFDQLCRRVLEVEGYTIVLTGTGGERNLCADVAVGLGPEIKSVAGMLSLTDLIALLSQAVLFVGNDSGTGHLAGGLGIPTISLHVQARTSHPEHISAPGHYKPAGPCVTVSQPAEFIPPCEDRCESSQAHCINQISVEEVWAAVQSHLSPVLCLKRWN